MAYNLFPGETLVTAATHKAEYILEVDGNLRKTEFIDTSDDGGARVRNGDLRAGRALKPDHIPTKVKRSPPAPQPLSDFYPAGGAFYVSDRFKALVEEFEPGVHQFFPVTIKSGNKHLGSLYFFNICNRIDGMDHDACIPPILPGQRVYQSRYEGAEKIVLSRKKIAGVHIWRDKRSPISVYISDAFCAAMRAANLVNPQASGPVEEVD
jgi:hypothetical protein